MALPLQRGRVRRERVLAYLPAAVRLGLRTSWPFAVAGAVVWATGRYGFSPTDDEFVLAGSWRLLEGEVPHRDVVSARPMGSAVLHLVDFALPGPLFLDGRFTTAVEFVLIAWTLLVPMVRSVRGLGTSCAPALPSSALVAVASVGVMLLNLQTFPLTPWHTVDGMACAAGGWFLLADGLDRRSSGRRRFGLFLVGFATICKQSFALVPLVAVCMLVARRADYRRSWRSRRTPVTDALMLVSAPAAYLLWVALAGGLQDAVTQLTASPAVWSRPMLFEIWRPFLANSTAVATGVVFLAAVAGWALARRPSTGSAILFYVSATTLTLAVVGTMLGAALGEAAGAGIVPFAGNPIESSSLVWWMCIILTVGDALIERRLCFPAFATCALAWMASLSWGYTLPALLQGSLAAAALVLTWRRNPTSHWQRPLRPAVRAVATVALFTVVLASSALVLDQRSINVYRDAPRAQLSADLAAVSPAGRGIRTSAPTAAYMRELSTCVRTHPATWVAILPDTAAAYPLLRLHDPFPSDWMVTPELVGDADTRILARADQLNATGDYLVLVHEPDPFIEQVMTRLSTSEPVRCGVLVGRWSPHHAVS